MAELRASYSYRLDTSNLPFHVSVNETTFLYNPWSITTLGKNYAVLHGKGIKGEPWQPITAGKITGISMYKNDNFFCSLSGVSFSAPDYFTWKTKSNREIGEDLLAGSDSISGSLKADVLDGFRGNDTIRGDAGYDRLIGNAGNDTLSGEAGRDTLTGGSGRDKFVFDTEPMLSSLDRVTDFTRGEDRFYLSRSVFKDIGLKGALEKGIFRSATAAQDSTDRILYNKKTGVLSFDPDGNGALGQVAFAAVDKGLALATKDFYIL